MKKFILGIFLLGFIISCHTNRQVTSRYDLDGQEIYWYNGLYQIKKSNILGSDLYSSFLFLNDYIKVRIVYYGSRLFLIIDRIVSDDIDIETLVNEEFEFIFHYDTYINNWGKYINKDNDKFIFCGNSELIMENYTYLIEGLDALETALLYEMNLDLPEDHQKIYYCAEIGSLLEKKKNIEKIKDLIIDSPFGFSAYIGGDYSKQAIQEMFKIGFRLGLK